MPFSLRRRAAIAALSLFSLAALVSTANAQDKVGISIGNAERTFELGPLDAAQLPRSLDDLTLASINNDYAEKAGLSFVRDAVIKESPRGPYANLIAVRRADKGKPWAKKLVAACQSAEVRQFIETTFKGALIPAFGRRPLRA